jgi:hypothetical protein
MQPHEQNFISNVVFLKIDLPNEFHKFMGLRFTETLLQLASLP